MSNTEQQHRRPRTYNVVTLQRPTASTLTAATSSAHTTSTTATTSSAAHDQGSAEGQGSTPQMSPLKVLQTRAVNRAKTMFTVEFI